MDFGQVNITATGPQPLADDDGTSGLIFNTDDTVTVWLVDDPMNAVADPQYATPLPPLASAAFDGSAKVYGVTAPGSAAVVSRFPGGSHFFQLVELLVKTLIVSATKGNGVYVYDTAPAIGHLIGSISSPATLSDPEGNPTEPGLTSYTNTGASSVFAQLFSGALTAGLLNAAALAGKLATVDLTGAGSWAWALTSPKVGAGDTVASLVLQSQGYSSSGLAAGVLARGAPATESTNALWEVQGEIAAVIAAAAAGLSTRRPGDPSARWLADSDGKQTWSGDTTLYRALAGALAVDDLVANLSGTAETWHSMNTRGYQNGWTDSGNNPPGQYRLVPSPANMGQPIGSLSTPNAPPDGQVVINLPLIYHPASNQPNFSGRLIVPSNAAVQGRFNMLSNGNMTVTGLSALPAGTEVIIPESALWRMD